MKKIRFQYQGLFDAFGPRRRMQVLAAVAIGALVGFTGARRNGAEPSEYLGYVAGGGTIGLVGGLLLVLLDWHKTRRPWQHREAVLIGLLVILILVLTFCEVSYRLMRGSQ